MLYNSFCLFRINIKCYISDFYIYAKVLMHLVWLVKNEISLHFPVRISEIVNIENRMF
jgi:hypothetical protein